MNYNVIRVLTGHGNLAEYLTSINIINDGEGAFTQP